jgi:hypothetical protein
MCAGSYALGVWVNPTTKSAECQYCGRRFDKPDLAGEAKEAIPLHSPDQRHILRLKREQERGE